MPYKGSLCCLRRGVTQPMMRVCQMPLNICGDFSRRKQTDPCLPDRPCQPGLWVWFSRNIIGLWCLHDFHVLAPCLSCHLHRKCWNGLFREKPSPFCAGKEIISSGILRKPVALTFLCYEGESLLPRRQELKSSGRGRARPQSSHG